MSFKQCEYKCIFLHEVCTDLVAECQVYNSMTYSKITQYQKYLKGTLEYFQMVELWHKYGRNC